MTKKQLVSFGNYLLSEERKQKILKAKGFKKEVINARLTSVSHADINNWKQSLEENTQCQQ